MKIIVRALALGMLLTAFAADSYVSAKTASSSTKTVTVASSMGPHGSCTTYPFCESVR